MIEKSVLLHCSREKAFKLFTEHISKWWPSTHRLTKDPESELFMEQSGRFWERARDGREAELGRVIEWEPPARMKLDFYMGTTVEQPTLVDVSFTEIEDGTRITIRHQAKPESADVWNGRALSFARSWEAVLAALVASVTRVLPFTA
jgi:hypothetical protein